VRLIALREARERLFREGARERLLREGGREKLFGVLNDVKDALLQ